MIIGYLLVCIGLECRTFVDNFESMEACNKAGTEAWLMIPKVYPQVTKVKFKCEPAGQPA